MRRELGGLERIGLLGGITFGGVMELAGVGWSRVDGCHLPCHV